VKSPLRIVLPNTKNNCHIINTMTRAARVMHASQKTRLIEKRKGREVEGKWKGNWKEIKRYRVIRSKLRPTPS